MKKAALLAFALLTGALAASPAFAWGRSHVFVGFNFGFPVYAPYYYPPPVPVYYPTPVVVQQQPQVYVERNDMPQAAAPQAQAQNYWYYCAGSKSYYPYVKDCPGGWQRVSPTPQ